MAEKDHKRITDEIYTGIAYLKYFIKVVDQKINKLMESVNSLKSDNKVEALKVQIGVLRKDQEDVKQRFSDFKSQFCQLDNLEIAANMHTDEMLEDVKVIVDMFKEEQNVKNRLNGMMIEIGICETNKEGGSAMLNIQDGVKKRMEEWIKECEESDEERETLKAIKDRAIEIGTELSFMLVNLMFIMSKRKKLLERYQEFKFSFRLLIEHESFKLINNMINIMEMAKQEMREVKKKSMERISEHNLNQLKKGLFDELLVQIFKEVQHLDYVFRNPGLRGLKMLRKFVGLKQCEEYLNGIEMRINELKESFSFIFESEEVRRFEFCNRAVQGKIQELWNQFGESLEKVLRNN